MKSERLIDVYRFPRNSGIFYDMFKDAQLKSLFNQIDINTEDDAHAVDLDYILNNSGLKSTSVLLQYIIDGLVIDDNGNLAKYNDGRMVSWDYVLIQVDKDIINNVIKIRFLNKWQKLIDTINKDYDPLAPYKIDLTRERSSDLYSTGSNSAKSKDVNGYEDKSGTSTYAYNSDVSKPVDESKDSGSSTNESNSTNKNDYHRGDTSTERVTRTGNTGNHTSQELIRAQRETLKYQVICEIYADLDSILTRSKYI